MLWLLAGTAAADPTGGATIGAEAPLTDCAPCEATVRDERASGAPPAAGDGADTADAGPLDRAARSLFDAFSLDAERYSIVSAARGLSTHKPMYLLPYSWSSEYNGADSELVFQFSVKHSIAGTGLYFGYTQQSYWQAYNSDESRPFRETNYNPELFYRWTPDPEIWRGWGADAGIEHISNGEDVPDSRSWNRIYVAPFRAAGRTALYSKFWYRLPEDEKDDPLDTDGDDNPDITDYYGHAELSVLRQLDNAHLVNLMLRGNLAEGHGAVRLEYTIPSRDGYVFWMLYAFHGYGESLQLYDERTTRIGIGAALSR